MIFILMSGAIPPARTDVDLYAQWIPLPPPVCHTLSYRGNDAGGPRARGVPHSERVPSGQYALISRCVPYRACYCFTGWNTDPRGRGQMVCVGQSFGPMTGDVCLYAQWRRLPPSEPTCVRRDEPDGQNTRRNPFSEQRDRRGEEIRPAAVLFDRKELADETNPMVGADSSRVRLSNGGRVKPTSSPRTRGASLK